MTPGQHKSYLRYTSQFYGVSWHHPSRRWQVRIRIGYHRFASYFFLGGFPEDMEWLAAVAYDNAAWWLQDFRKYKPRLNHPEDRFPMRPRTVLIRARLIAGGYPRFPAHFPDFIAPPDEEVLKALPPDPELDPFATLQG